MDIEKILNEIQRERGKVFLKRFIQKRLKEGLHPEQREDFEYVLERIEKDQFDEPIESNKDLSRAMRIHVLEECFTCNDTKKEEYQFIVKFLNSKFIKDRSDEEIISELKQLVPDPEKYYSRMLKILDAGIASNLDDIVECGSFESRELFLKKLGSGVSGNTYLVQSQDLGHELAMKIVEEDMFNPDEAKILLELDHINIVKVRYAGDHFVKRKDKNVNAILMDYVDGDTIWDILQKRKKLTYGEVIDFSSQLLNGITYLRTKEIFHKDINPKNVKIDSEGLVKIIDFGIAKKDIKSRPESNRRYGGNSDIFSWALITYKMFKGKHLFLSIKELLDPTVYTERIKYLKKELRDENGKLNEKYVKKVKYLPKELEKALQIALENTEEFSEEERLEKIVSCYKKLNPKKRKYNKINLIYRISVGFRFLASGLIIVSMLALGRAVYKGFKYLESQTQSAWKQFEDESQIVQQQIEEISEKLNDPSTIEQIIIENYQPKTFEPITITVEGKKLEKRYVHWIIDNGWKNNQNVDESEFNCMSTKIVFVEPGDYRISCENWWWIGIESSELRESDLQEDVFVMEGNRNKNIDVIVNYPKEPVLHDKNFVIDASKSTITGGRIDRYFIQFGDGSFREGKIENLNDLKFHHSYSPVDMTYGSRHVSHPFFFTLVLYDQNGLANYGRGAINTKYLFE